MINHNKHLLARLKNRMSRAISRLEKLHQIGQKVNVPSPAWIYNSLAFWRQYYAYITISRLPFTLSHVCFEDARALRLMCKARYAPKGELWRYLWHTARASLAMYRLALALRKVEIFGFS